MKTILNILLFVSLSCAALAQEKITISNFSHLNDTYWTGNLMYVNYGDGKEENVAAQMEIEIVGEILFQRVSYPDEPRKNSTSKVRIKRDGRYFGEEEIIDFALNDNKITSLETKFEGRDDTKKAIIFKKYLFEGDQLSITKTVVYKKTGEKLVRNQYSFTRK